MIRNILDVLFVLFGVWCGYAWAKQVNLKSAIPLMFQDIKSLLKKKADKI